MNSKLQKAVFYNKPIEQKISSNEHLVGNDQNFAYFVVQ